MLKCYLCEKLFERNQKNSETERKVFCSKSCAAKHNNRVKPKRLRTRVCVGCGKLCKASHTYCSNDCRSSYRTSLSLQKIEKGEITEPKTIKFNLQKFNEYRICSECGQGETWNGKVLVLQLDHIDGNSDNNKLENLRILCPNCHTQTETFTSRQKKEHKRNRYLQKYKSS